MRDAFEVRDHDAAGRIGALEVPRAGVTVETPALMPVVNPHLQTVPPADLESEFGAEILITNGYVFYGSDEYRQRALDEGLHDLLDFSGAVVTDSGSFQLAEYGEIDVTTEEILEFQREIGSDVATPVDVPTPPDASREQAAADLEKTAEALAVAESVDTGDMLVNAPVQGSSHLDLREAAAERASATDLDVFPVGAVVPLLNDYRYDDVVDVVRAAKRGLGLDAPVHLFGAGHPMMFALAVAAGCDLFDSAAYALYARDDRYLTVRGTEHLDDLDYLPCSCPICTSHTPDEVARLGDDDREATLARHNLHVTYGELRTVKQAVRDGDLLELVEQRARAHPAMADGYAALLDHADELERTDPASKGAFFGVSAESARRPEVARHRERLERLAVAGDEVLLSEGGNNDRYDATWRVTPPFGPYPPALSKTYPLTAQVRDRRDRPTCEAAAEGVRRLVAANPDTEFALAHFDWPASALDRLPEMETYDLTAEDGSDPEGDTPATGAESEDETDRPPEDDR